MENAVHLEVIRCNGEGHGGCQAGCLIFWHEAWVKRIDKNVVSAESLRTAPAPSPVGRGLCTVASLVAASSHVDAGGEKIYSCQATDVLKFTSFMRSWDPMQYVRDLRSGNLSTGLAENGPAQRALDAVLGVMQILRAIAISAFNRVQQWRNWRASYPYIEGRALTNADGKPVKTPLELLNLQPGELVQVRSREEIFATLDKQFRNRGLLFDGELLTYCGGIYRVLRRVHQIIDEKNGKMIYMKNPCIVLDGVACRSDYHRLCPKAIYHYWRENWLQRASEPQAASSPPRQMAETCEKC